MDILSKSEARSLSLKHFYTGIPCKNGHIAKRYVSTGGCVECVNNNSLRRKQANPEKFLENCRQACRKWSKKHEAEYRRKRQQVKPEEGAVKAKTYRLRHPDRVSAYQNEYRARNRDRLVELTIDYWRRNPDARRAARAAYGARKKGAEGRYTADDVERLKLAQGMLCNGCKCDLNLSKYHVDHIMPLALGGSNLPDNLQLLCPDCNRRKHKKHPDRWKRELPGT